MIDEAIYDDPVIDTDTDYQNEIVITQAKINFNFKLLHPKPIWKR